MTDLQRKLLAAFQLEYRDHLACVRQLLQDSDQSSLAQEGLNEIHRRIHSLKGAARAVDIEAVEALSHQLEDQLKAIVDGEKKLDREQIKESLDAIEDAVLVALESDKSAPSQQTQNSQSPLTLSQSQSQSEHSNRSANTTNLGWLRLSSEDIDQVFNTAMEIVTQVEGFKNSRLKMVSDSLSTLAQQIKKQQLNATDLQAQVCALAETAISQTTQDEQYWLDIRRLTRRLEKELAYARMMPAGDVFGDLAPVLRQLADNYHKKVKVRLEGLDTIADRQVLQALREPILHLLNNAVIHGIESPATRLQKGKPEPGEIKMTVAARAGQLYISVYDDGGGLDIEAIRKSAIQSGFGREQQFDFDRAVEFALKPHFSTAKKVTLGAGRGVGLSAVFNQVKALHGFIKVEPGETQGSQFRIEVPLSKVTSRLLLFKVNDQLFTLPKSQVSRVLRLDYDDIKKANGRCSVDLADYDRPVTIFSVAECLGLKTPNFEDQSLWCLQLNVGKTPRLCVIDEMVAVIKAIVEPFNLPIGFHPAIQGSVHHAGKPLILSLDGFELVNRAETTQNHLERSQTDSEEIAPCSVLVVDDSVTTLTLEKSVLDAYGYQVTTAMDGEAALAKLNNQDFSLLISDIQMPKLNGFQLLQHIRSDSKLQDLPVILLSSLQSAEEQKRGLDLGANAYLVKQEFNQRELIGLVESLAGKPH